MVFLSPQRGRGCALARRPLCNPPPSPAGFIFPMSRKGERLDTSGSRPANARGKEPAMKTMAIYRCARLAGAINATKPVGAGSVVVQALQKGLTRERNISHSPPPVNTNSPHFLQSNPPVSDSGPLTPFRRALLACGDGAFRR